jgi:hypothetical protein
MVQVTSISDSELGEEYEYEGSGTIAIFITMVHVE